MEEGQLDEAILVALRNSPGSRSEELAEAVDLPRTNFGRRLKHSLREPLERLLAEGSIEKDRGRYRLTEKGRRRLAARADGFEQRYRLGAKVRASGPGGAQRHAASKTDARLGQCSGMTPEHAGFGTSWCRAGK